MIKLYGYGQEYDDADPMLGDYADLAQKGFGIFKKVGQGLKKVAQKIKARRAKRKGKGKPVAVASPAVKLSPTTTAYMPTVKVAPSSDDRILVDHPQGLPKWVIPAVAVGAAYLLLRRRGS
jgi:hypothetical protein